jgi:cell wall assembly regulator SMI1
VDPGVQALFWNERWLPFARDGRGGVVCVDLAPAPAGVVGQVIFVGRDPDERTVLGASLQEWLASVTFSAIPVP